ARRQKPRRGESAHLLPRVPRQGGKLVAHLDGSGAAGKGGVVPLLPRRHDLLALLAQSLDAERDHVASFEEFRLRLHAEPDAGRRAGDDNVARLHDEILRAGPDDLPAIEDLRRGIAALAFLAVDVEPHLEILRVLKFIFGDEPGSERAEGLAAFAFGPLSGTLDLKHALRDVVGKAITGNDVKRPFFAQI